MGRDENIRIILTEMGAEIEIMMILWPEFDRL